MGKLKITRADGFGEVLHGIVEVEQGGRVRADYGEELIRTLSLSLTQRFGRGFSVRNLECMRGLYSAWPGPRITSKQALRGKTNGSRIRTDASTRSRFGPR